MQLAIDEKDLFRSLVRSPEASQEEREQILLNLQHFSYKVPLNIFKNEWYAMYEALIAAKQYNGLLNYRQYHQVLLNNIEKILATGNVNVEDFATDPKNDLNTKQEFLALALHSFEDVMNSTHETDDFKINLDLYVQSWGDERFRELLGECYEINTKGKKVKGKGFIQGGTAAHEYYLENAEKINSVLNSAETSVPPIIISPEGYREMKNDKNRDRPQIPVSHTNIKFVDERVGELVKGDVVTILGQTGGGKSRFAVNIGYNAMMRGENGVDFCLEGKLTERKNMYIARHIAERYGKIGITTKELNEKTYDPKYQELIDEAEFDLFNNPAYGRLMILPPPLYDNEVVTRLGLLWDTWMPFSWLLLDYASLVLSRKFDDRRSMLEKLIPELQSASKSLKGEGFLLIMPHQLTKEAYLKLAKGDDETLAGSSDSSEINKSSDIIFSVFTDEELKAKNKMVLINTKLRDGQGFPKTEVLAFLGSCLYNDLPKQ